MRKKIALCFLILSLTAAACFSISSYAFDGNDYDSGGDWDSGSDWSSNWDDDGSGGGSLDWPSTAIAAVIIIFILVKASRKNGASKPAQNQAQRSIQLPDRTAQIESILKAHDGNFSADDFISFVKRVYIDIQTAWCKRDLSPVRIFLHDNLYDATVKQIQAKIDQGVVYHYESMVVNTAYLTSYAKDGQYEYLTVYLNARMIDWQEDEKTGKILRGDKNTRWELRYKMKFMRSLGVLTREESDRLTGRNCPNCGAPLEMTSSTQCTYCNSTVTTGKYSWVLSDFGTVRNDTVDEGVRME